MIRGHIYQPLPPGASEQSQDAPASLPDPLGDAFHALRAEMIRREADRYPSLEKELRRRGGANQLTICSGASDEDEEDQLRDFIMSLEDNSLGYLFWEIETGREASLLNSIDVSCMSIQGPDGELLP